jgi:hypothetical protein
MQFFVRAVVYGFALSLGQALFKKIEGRIGLGEPKDKTPDEPEAVREGGSTPTPDQSLPS